MLHCILCVFSCLHDPSCAVVILQCNACQKAFSKQQALLVLPAPHSVVGVVGVVLPSGKLLTSQSCLHWSLHCSALQGLARLGQLCQAAL